MTDEQWEELRRNIASSKFESWLVGKTESWLVGKFESGLVVRAKIVLDEKLPEGFGSWKGNLIARHLGVKVGQVWRVVHRNGADLRRRRSWCAGADPEFAAEAADIVGF